MNRFIKKWLELVSIRVAAISLQRDKSELGFIQIISVASWIFS
jgi:hypothetical protein